MSGLGAELQKVSSTQNARLQLQRSTSETPTVPKLHRSHHHPHLHHRDKTEKVEKSAPASLLPSVTLDGAKSEVVTPNGSQYGSRRTSVVPSADDMPGSIGQQEKRRVVRDGDIQAERDKSILRAAELRKELVDLNTLSNSATSRLDNTYYNVLEKLSILHSTITSLKELATLTRLLNDDFIKGSSEIVKDIETQLESFSNFRPQERKIEDLEHRIETGREKTQTLGARVELVKQKIERWEKVESEWQQRTRKRLKFLWAITAISLLLLVGLIAFQYTPARTQGPATLKGFDMSNTTAFLRQVEDALGNETQVLKRTAIDALEKLRRVPPEELEDEPRLRAFDEL